MSLLQHIAGHKVLAKQSSIYQSHKQYWKFPQIDPYSDFPHPWEIEPLLSLLPRKHRQYSPFGRQSVSRHSHTKTIMTCASKSVTIAKLRMIGSSVLKFSVQYRHCQNRKILNFHPIKSLDSYILVLPLATSTGSKLQAKTTLRP